MGGGRKKGENWNSKPRGNMLAHKRKDFKWDFPYKYVLGIYRLEEKKEKKSHKQRNNKKKSGWEGSDAICAIWTACSCGFCLEHRGYRQYLQVISKKHGWVTPVLHPLHSLPSHTGPSTRAQHLQSWLQNTNTHRWKVLSEQNCSISNKLEVKHLSGWGI